MRRRPPRASSPIARRFANRGVRAFAAPPETSFAIRIVAGRPRCPSRVKYAISVALPFRTSRRSSRTRKRRIRREGAVARRRRRGGRARGVRCARGAVCLSRTSRRWWRTWSASTREARGARESPRRSVGYADARGTSDRCDWKCTLSVDYKTTVVPGSIRCSAYSPASWRAPVARPPPTPCRPDSCSPRRPSSRPPPTATPVASASSRGWIRCA